MKRGHKIVIGVGALFGAILVGTVWLADAALGIVDDTVDTTLKAAKHVENLAQASRNHPIPAVLQQTKSITPQESAKQPAANVKLETPIENGTPGAPVAINPGEQRHEASRAGEQADDDIITNLTRIVGPFIDDSDGASPSVVSLVRSFDKSDNEEDWLSLVPGGNSPTLKHWREGKYRGNEDQAFEDALYDPQAWRLISFFSGL